MRPLVVRALLPSLIVSCIVPLSGCSDTPEETVFTVAENQQVTAANGTQLGTGACGKEGRMSLSYSQEAGTLRVVITDGDGKTIHDTGPMTSAVSTDSRTATFAGEPGTWTVTVHRTSFTGSYAAQVAC